MKYSYEKSQSLCQNHLSYFFSYLWIKVKVLSSCVSFTFWKAYETLVKRLFYDSSFRYFAGKNIQEIRATYLGEPSEINLLPGHRT